MTAAPAKSLSLLGLLLLILLSSGLKLILIRADAPRVFPNGFQSSDPVKDEAAKSYEARNRARFGTWTTSPADDYRYWNTLSPLWTHSLWLWFELFGVSYTSLRLFSIFWSALAILAAWWFFPDPKDSRAGPLAAIFFASNFYLLTFGRLGLMETGLNTMLLFCLLVLVRALDRPRLFPLAALLLLLSYLIKQSAAAVLPVFCLAALLLPPGKNRRAWLSFGLILLAIAALFLWPDYRLRSVMNFRHALGWRPDPSWQWMRLEIPVTRQALAQAFGRTGLVQGFFLMMPVAGPLALLEILIFLYRWLKTKTFDRTEAIAIAWLLCARLALAFSPHTAVRFYLIQFPPACLLAGILLQRMWGLKNLSPRSQRLRVEILIALSLLLDLGPYEEQIVKATFQMKNDALEFQKALGDSKAVIIGEWAAPFALEGNYRTYYVKNIFNRRPDQLRQFGVTHLLFLDPDQDPAIKSFREAFPGPFEQRKIILTLPFQDEILTLCRVEVPKGNGPP